MLENWELLYIEERAVIGRIQWVGRDSQFLV